MSAPIRKRNRGKKPWMLDLRYFGGRREFYATRDEAEGAREAALRDHKNFGAVALSLTAEQRSEYVRLTERASKLGVSLDGALDFYERNRPLSASLPLADAIEKLKELKLSSNKRKNSVRAFGTTLKLFSSSVGVDRLVSSIRREEIENWLFKNGWAPATVRTKFIDLRTFFNAARARGWSNQDPIAGIERVHLDDTAPGIFNTEQCEKLLRACQKVAPEFCGYFALALFCGIRPEQIDKMKKEHVHIERGFVEAPSEIAKSRKRRIVELSENAKAWLRVGLELPPRNRRGKLNAVRLAGGFAGWKRQTVKGKKLQVPVPGIAWPHDVLRHTFASNHLAMHGSADKTATQMGHRSTDTIFQHYRELVTKEDAERFWKIIPE